MTPENLEKYKEYEIMDRNEYPLEKVCKQFLCFIDLSRVEK